MKKDAYYFSHDANAQDDPKMMVLIDQLGMEGYGIFWAIIEKLRNEAEYRLPLSVTASFARRWGTSREKVDTVILKYGLFIVEDEYFFSLRLRRSMIEKSEKARVSANYRWQNANALPSHSERSPNGMRNDAIKVKERKGKKSNLIDDLFEAFWDKYANKIDKNQALKAWSKLSESERQKAIDYIPIYFSNLQEWQSKKYPATYLNGKSWEDGAEMKNNFIPIKKMVD
jgi:hypothetical protein